MMSITIVCAVMNRSDMLKISLMSWLKYKEVSRIIVVDWSSSDLSDDFIKFIYFLDNRIEIKRVDGEDTFHIASAYNLAVSLVDTEYILKLDVDYVLNPYFNFFDNNRLGPKEFFTGDWRWHSLDNNLGFLKFLNGLLYIKTADFKAVGGYDERFVGYGYEDTDLYNRLEKHGLTHRFICVKDITVYHNPHSDAKRVENYVEKDLKKAMSKNMSKHYDERA